MGKQVFSMPPSKVMCFLQCHTTALTFPFGISLLNVNYTLLLVNVLGIPKGRKPIAHLRSAVEHWTSITACLLPVRVTDPLRVTHGSFLYIAHQQCLKPTWNRWL